MNGGIACYFIACLGSWPNLPNNFTISLAAENSHLGTLWVKRKLNLAFKIDLPCDKLEVNIE